MVARFIRTESSKGLSIRRRGNQKKGSDAGQWLFMALCYLITRCIKSEADRLVIWFMGCCISSFGKTARALGILLKA
jgi:hypothetical protein